MVRDTELWCSELAAAPRTRKSSGRRAAQRKAENPEGDGSDFWDWEQPVFREVLLPC